MANDVVIHIRATDHTAKPLRDAKGRFAKAGTEAAQSFSDSVERKVKTSFATRLKTAFRKVGLDSGLSFGSGLLNGISLGRLGGGVATKLAPEMAKAGARLGGVFAGALAGALLVQGSNLLTAGLPLLLGGGLMAGPLAWLIKGNVQGMKDLEKQAKKIDSLKARIAKADPDNFSTKTGKSNARKRQAELREELAGHEKIVKKLEEQTKSWAKTKEHAGQFMDKISKPLRLPFQHALKEVRDGLDRLEGPMTRILKGIGPALAPFTKGIMNGLVEFVKALEPRMPSIKEGMKAWGEAAPKIGKGLGDFLAKLMKDPEGTVQALQDLGQAMQDMADAAANIITQVGEAAAAYGKFADKIDEYENRTDSKGGPLKAMEGDLKKFRKHFDKFWGPTGAAKVDEFSQLVKEKAKGIWTGVKHWLGKIPPWLNRQWGKIVGEVKGPWSEAKSIVASRAKGIYHSVTSTLKGIPAWVARNARDAVNRLKMRWNEAKAGVKGAFKGAGTWLKDIGLQIIHGLVKGIDDGKHWVQEKLGEITAAIPGWKGPKSKDKKLLVEVGRTIMSGLISGFKQAEPDVAAYLKRFTDRIDDKRVSKKLRHRLDDIANTYENVLGKKNKGLDRIQEQLKAQIGKLRELRDAARAYAAELRGQVVGSFLDRKPDDSTAKPATAAWSASGDPLDKYTQTADPGPAPLTGKSIAGQMKARLQLQRAFLAGLKQLKRRGLDRGILKELLDAGADESGGFIHALLGDRAQIKIVNSLQRQLRKIGDRTAKFGVATFHAAGINAAVGLVKGLEKQEDRMVAAIERLATRLVKAFKKKLKIHSPSEVLAAEVGEPAAQGVGVGFERGWDKVLSSLQNSMSWPSGGGASPMAAGGGGIVVENHIEIGGEVVRVVRHHIAETGRSAKRKATAGNGGGY